MASSTPFSGPSSSSPSPSILEDEGPRNWAELPPELTATILHRLGAVEILTTAQMVCKWWRSVSKDPSMWREIDMRNSGDLQSMEHDLEIMCLHAVGRSLGGLVGINIEYFGTDSLLASIADSSTHLQRLRLVSCYEITDEGLVEAVMKLPLLEDLEVSYCSVSGDALRAVGRSCPLLKTLKLNCPGYRRPRIECDDDALAIAQSMPELRHLQLFGNRLTETGLYAILDSCPHLEHLDLRQCFNLNLVGNLGKRCSEKIKDLRRPNDPTDDYAFDATVIDMVSSDDDYPYGFSDIDLLSDDEYHYEFSGASDYSDYGNYDYDYYDDEFFL
ncbi:PREDICTED: F-box protein SKIP19 [Tarenaya hassleriana]|uniref:F-box protein SKIP19 n=1 Tax=Tarenaya hassleriana TaxID=28532 RepID=UPI00053C50BF|nr:PREDICTED: F-box protein SKIP19 [Tarenaya hassleriana]